MNAPWRDGLGRWALASGVAVATLVAFLPALEGDFVDFDDLYNFTLNARYRGLAPRHLAWMLGIGQTTHFWGPLAWLSLALDWAFWGMHPWGYHLTNLLLHAASGAAFLVLAERLLTRAMPGASTTRLRLGAAAAALFWTLHPLRVESVAWISERRDVLSGVLLLLTVLAWLRALDAPAPARRRWLLTAVAAYVLSILAKPIGMTLPLVLLVLDVYPLRRLTPGRGPLSVQGRAVLREKAPFLAVALVGALVALALTHEIKGVSEHPLWVRPALFGYGLTFTLWKTVFPLGLSVLYEIPARWSPTDPRLIAGTLVSAAVTLAAWRARRRWPAPLAAWAAAAIVFAPVSGLAVHGGPQIAADRYTYLPAMPLALLVGGGVCLLLEGAAVAVVARSAARGLVGVLAVWLAGFGVLTWQQSEVWRDSVTLWDRAVVFQPDCARCLHGLGVAWYRAGNLQAAAMSLERAVMLRPDIVPFRADLGLALIAVDQPGAALPHLQIAADRFPRNHDFRRRLGTALLEAGRPEQAQRQFEMVLTDKPGDPDALTGVGFALVAAGRPADSVTAFEEAIAAQPTQPFAYYGLARAYLALGQPDRALSPLETLRRLDPALAARARR